VAAAPPLLFKKLRRVTRRRARVPFQLVLVIACSSS
jgi:hypothetical protein